MEMSKKKFTFPTDDDEEDLDDFDEDLVDSDEDLVDSDEDIDISNSDDDYIDALMGPMPMMRPPMMRLPMMRPPMMRPPMMMMPGTAGRPPTTTMMPGVGLPSRDQSSSLVNTSTSAVLHNQMGMPSVQSCKSAPASSMLNGLNAAMSHSHMSMGMHSAMSGNTIPRNQGGGMRDIASYFSAQNVDKVYLSVPTRYGTDESRQAPTIHKVPLELERCADDYQKQDYRPVAVIIGGFNDLSDRHRSKSKLEGYKWRCVSQLISRNKKHLEPAKTRVLLHECSERLERVVPRIRDSYGQDIKVSDYRVVEIMLLDGCFILHRLLKLARLASGGGGDDWTQVHGWCWVWQSATRDLLLLENQIPFFVLRELFQQLRNDDEPEELLITGSLRLFQSLRPQMLHSSPIQIYGVHHLLHLFYLSIGFPRPDGNASTTATSLPGPGTNDAHVFLPELPQWVPCAKELEEAGVRFRSRNLHKVTTSFLDITFDPRLGILEIPSLQLYDSSSSLFRNLIAFEQAYPGTRCDVSAYAVFMDCLIKTPEDMRILHLHGILVNQMNGQQDATRFFSTICANVHYPTDNYLVGLMTDVNKYKASRRHKWRAALLRNYFGNPWVATSVLAAVLLLAMTVLQTFFTVYPYFKPSG